MQEIKKAGEAEKPPRQFTWHCARCNSGFEKPDFKRTPMAESTPLCPLCQSHWVHQADAQCWGVVKLAEDRAARITASSATSILSDVKKD